jgi:hypothetical protein
VDDAIRLQEAADLAAVTDGELRRLSFQSRLLESEGGVGTWTIDAFLWGDWMGSTWACSLLRDWLLGLAGRLGPISRSP